ncbi:MAG: site-specific DNA-methyltransferase [Candidatus Thorarchaeota archaeon]|nr:site-specific DNA-methyltransferase [Candidatus Thorarchaeota archaeon]
MKHLQSNLEEKLQLIYIDPPYFSGTDYSLKKKRGSKKNQAPHLIEEHTYSDKWKGGLSEYLEFMKERLIAMKSLLREEGSIWVHLDFHVSHYVKTIMDDIFGYQNFVNEIIWKRTNSPKAQSKGFGSQHDVILLYAVDRPKFRTKAVYRNHDENSLKPYSYHDDRGRFRLIEIEAQGIQRSESRKQFEWRGRTAPYLYRKETLDEWWENNIIYTSKNRRYSKKQYLEDIPGVQVSDLWLDIPPIQGASKEYSGFLTQKPIALLRRVIESATAPGDIVGDFFAGSGTTAIAAHQIERNWIICDTTKVAIDLASSRLADIDADDSFDTIVL